MRIILISRIAVLKLEHVMALEVAELEKLLGG